MADTANRGPVSRPKNASEGGVDNTTLEKERVYEEIEGGPEFKALQKAKLNFIVPATIFFLLYYFALPVLVGFFGVNSDGTPGFMDTRVFPGVSIAYLFALSQFIMAWILAFIYLLSFAPKMDKMVNRLTEMVTNFNTRQAEKGGR